MSRITERPTLSPALVQEVAELIGAVPQSGPNFADLLMPDGVTIRLRQHAERLHAWHVVSPELRRPAADGTPAPSLALEPMSSTGVAHRILRGLLPHARERMQRLQRCRRTPAHTRPARSPDSSNSLAACVGGC